MKKKTQGRRKTRRGKKKGVARRLAMAPAARTRQKPPPVRRAKPRKATKPMKPRKVATPRKPTKPRARPAVPEPTLSGGAPPPGPQESGATDFGLPVAPQPAGIPGVDTPGNAAAQLACISAAGMRFIARYYARGNRPKIIRRAEAQAISAAGMGIVAVWESGYPTTVDYFARAQGNADGADAHARAAEIGQPRDTPIYFVVDYDADPAHLAGPILEYFRGVAEGLAGAAGGAARHLVGCYGSGIVCSALRAAGLARFSWLARSTGWRGHANFADWNIRQGRMTQLCGLDVDLDEGREPFGEFQVV